MGALSVIHMLVYDNYEFVYIALDASRKFN
jgi:hypothetical protein